MNTKPSDDLLPRTPFDDYPEGKGPRSVHLARLASLLRILSAVALVFAFVSAAAILVLDAAHLLGPGFTWRIKSALPLIGIGVSYALLRFTMLCRPVEFFLSMGVSLAFVLWGVEQYVPLPWIASLIDDVVVFLFVLDLAIVIRGRLMNRG